MDAFLESTCAQTIWLEPFAGASNDGRASPTYGTRTSYAARIEPENVIVELPGGERVSTTHFITTPAQVKPEDRLFIVDPSAGGRGRRILRVRELPDEYGAFDHCEVWI